MYILIILLFIIIYTLISSTVFQPFWRRCCCVHPITQKILEIEHGFLHKIFNPSLIQKNDKYILCVRNSTLSKKNILSYINGNINYKSSIVFLEIKKGKIQRIFSDTNTYNRYLEDPRIIEYNGCYLVSVTEYGKKIFPVLYIFDYSYNLIRRVHYSISTKNTQKNWCPFIHNDMVYIHTDTYPVWRVFHVDITNGKMNKKVEYNMSKILNKYNTTFLRCGTSWKIYDSSHYICGLHTKGQGIFPDIKIVLVLIDKNTLIPVAQTDMLCIDNKHSYIQFLSGLEVDNFYVTLACGINDYKILIKKIARHRLKFKQL